MVGDKTERSSNYIQTFGQLHFSYKYLQVRNNVQRNICTCHILELKSLCQNLRPSYPSHKINRYCVKTNIGYQPPLVYKKNFSTLTNKRYEFLKLVNQNEMCVQNLSTTFFLIVFILSRNWQNIFIVERKFQFILQEIYGIEFPAKGFWKNP